MSFPDFGVGGLPQGMQVQTLINGHSAHVGPHSTMTLSVPMLPQGYHELTVQLVDSTMNSVGIQDRSFFNVGPDYSWVKKHISASGDALSHCDAGTVRSTEYLR